MEKVEATAEKAEGTVIPAGLREYAARKQLAEAAAKKEKQLGDEQKNG